MDRDLAWVKIRPLLLNLFMLLLIGRPWQESDRAICPYGIALILGIYGTARAFGHGKAVFFFSIIGDLRGIR